MREAARYGERFLVPAIFEPLARELLARAPVDESDRLLDLACATAIVARLAVERGAAAGVGLDRNRARLQAAPGVPGVVLCHGDAARLPFRDGAFSIVACQHGLQFFADRAAALAESHRVLAPGGRLVASAWTAIDQSPGFHSLDRAVTEHAGSGAASASAVPFSLPDPDAVVAELSSAGFESPESFRFMLDLSFPSSADFVERFVGATSLAAHVGASALERVQADVGRDLQGYETGAGLVLPASAYLVTGRKAAA